MKWSVSETARILQASTTEVKTWASRFTDYLSPGANPVKGTQRFFEERDIMVLSYIQHHWEERPDVESISVGLNCNDHLQEPFCNILQFYKPFFIEPPDWLDEESFHGSLLGGLVTSNKNFTSNWIADSYKRAADSLIDEVISKGAAQGYELVFPILFLYRHALEVRLKMIVVPHKKDHQLEPLVSGLKRIVEHRQKYFRQDIIERLEEFSRFDPDSMAFRYATSKIEEPNIKGDETWIDLLYLKRFFHQLFEGLSRLETYSTRSG